MNLVMRLTDLVVVLVCARVVVRRYQGSTVRIVPGDVLLWTLSVFFVAPLALNVLGVRADYRIYRQLEVGHDEPLVRALAALGTAIAVLVAVWACLRAQRTERLNPPRPIRRLGRSLWLLGSLAPLAVAAMAPDPGAYRTFAAPFVLRGPGQPFSDPSGPVAQWNVFVSWSTYFSCIAFAVWFSARGRTRWAWLVAAGVGYMDLWLNGKRHIVAMFVLVLLFAAASSTELSYRQLRRGALRVAGLLLMVIAVSTWYQATFRPHVAERGEQLESFLVDFGRQDVLGLALAGHLGVEGVHGTAVDRPLDYAGQSIALHARSLVPGDPEVITYADRVTSIAAGQSIREQPGSITTSLISESVDNLGVVGLVVGPIVLAWLALAASYQNDPLLRVVGALVAATLTVVHVLAVVSVVVFMVGRILQLMMRRRRNAARGQAPPPGDRALVGARL